MQAIKQHGASGVGSASIERLELRSFLSGGAALVAHEVQLSPIPDVNGVFISGTDWTPTFRNAIEEYGFGYAALGAGATVFGSPKPWTNVDQITIRFSGDMIVESQHLRVFGANVVSYPVTSFRYRVDSLNFAGIATWTLGRSIPADKVLLRLDCSANGVRTRGDPGTPMDGDRDGQPGGDFRHRFDLLPGGFGGGVVVDMADVATVRAFSNRNIDASGMASPNPSFNVNADDRIDVRDVAEVRRRVGTSLPLYEPTGAAAAPASVPLRTRPVARTLFSTVAVLA